MDDVPGAPGGAGFSLLGGRGGAEAQAFHLLGGRLGREERHHDGQRDAEEEHPDTERVHVHLVEDVGKDVVGLRVDDHRHKAGAAQDQTGDKRPHAGLGRGLLPADTHEEHGCDGRSQQALDALDIVVETLAHPLDDEDPQDAEDNHDDGGDAADQHELLFRGIRMLALVDVYGIKHRGRVVQGSEGTHEGREDAADHHALQADRQEGVHEHREGDVRVGDGPVDLEAQGDGQLLSDGGIRSPGERVGDHAGDEEQEHREKLQVSTEDRTATGLLLVLAGEDALDDELVCAPVPETDDGGAEQGAVPREFAVLGGTHQIGHRIAVLVHGLGAADVHHGVPAAQFLQAEPEDDERAEQEDRCLKDRCLEDGFHAADDGVDGGDEHEGEGRHPEVDAQQGIQGQAARKDRNGHFGEDVTGQGQPGQDTAAFLVIAFFQELGHGIHHAAFIERNEHPAQDKDHPTLDFPMGLRHTGRRAGARQADKMLRSDVGGKDGCTDGNPRGRTAAQKIVAGGLFLLAGDIPDDPDHGHEENGDHDPVPGSERDPVQVCRCGERQKGSRHCICKNC